MRPTSLDQLCAWIEQTELSQAIQVHAWIVPSVQTIHILAIGAVMTSVFLINMHALGLAKHDHSAPLFFNRLRRVMKFALVVLLISGLLLICGEPVRSLENQIFQLKMVLLAIAIMMTLFIQVGSSHLVSTGEQVRHQGVGRWFAVLSMITWISILFAGRWIAYT